MQNRERPNASNRDIPNPFSKPTIAGQLHPFPKPKSKKFSALLDTVARCATNDSITIVLEGESGTGKNWLARFAHQQSRRASHKMREITLASVVDSLAASELFGHERGAFTDARERRIGAFQSANHSTLFIDELGKASSAVQRMLLRAIEERQICSLGSDIWAEVDVRLILATNVSLKSMVADKTFLADLFARLGQFRFYLPPLRERKEDIPDLVRFFVSRHAATFGYQAGLPTVHPSLMNVLVQAEWPYNLRDLDATMARLIFNADSTAQLTIEHCTGDLDYLRVHTRGRPIRTSPGSVASAVERVGTIADVARSLGMSRSTVYRKLAQNKKNDPPPSVAE